MALVRVYCGLASTQAGGDRPDLAQPWLTVAVVDDSGRLLDVCGITDDPAGYVELGAVLAERSGGFAGVAVAADSDEHQVTMLLAAAGRVLAIADEDSLDDYAERFGDAESPEEFNAPPAERRAIGLARALQAGALAATVQGAPRELMALKPVLAAHGALAIGRQGAAVALREVLRELYPAALRAYPDPTAPIPLAILDALPEPGMLGAGAATRGRDATVIAALADSGLADANRISEAVTSLRVAIAETPRRTGIGKTLTMAVAQTIRHAVAAVRAFDNAISAVVGLLDEKAAPVPTTRPGAAAVPPPIPLRPLREPAPTRDSASRETGVREPADVNRSAPSRRPRPQPAPVAPVSMPVVAAMPPPPQAPRNYPDVAAEYSQSGPGIPGPRLSPDVPAPGSRDDWPLTNSADSDMAYAEPRRPMEIDPLNPASYPSLRLDPSGPPLALPQPMLSQPTLPQRESTLPQRDSTLPQRESTVPQRESTIPQRESTLPQRESTIPQREGRVMPPWLSDDLPAEPTMLRLVEPAPMADRALVDRAPREDPLAGPNSFEMRISSASDPLGSRDDDRRYDRPGQAPSLRLIGGSAPVEDESDGDLLIFSQIQSAWFSDIDEVQAHGGWDDNPADDGWREAERVASSPTLGDSTEVGLPRRVPQANLVPGSPLPPQVSQRGLRVLRDPAAMAAHTTGYFRGSRRGEEVRGFSIGGRPGRESAGGWDFSRDAYDGDRDNGYEYRSAAHR